MKNGCRTRTFIAPVFASILLRNSSESRRFPAPDKCRLLPSSSASVAPEASRSYHFTGLFDTGFCRGRFFMGFSRVTLRRGMRNPAVAAVRHRLFCFGHLSTDGGNEYDERCESAVRSFQKDRGLTEDGIVGPQTWRSLYARDGTVYEAAGTGDVEGASVWVPAMDDGRRDLCRAARIDIFLSERTLTLYGTDGYKRTFPVAVGRPLSPTPTGTFAVRERIAHPEGVFGTRWIRLYPDTCHIHGTDEAWSVGAATTPGCLRMHNKDVEIIFHRIDIGTVVSIFP